ncbi:hypothetical protein AALO_G00284750 [Alosa alosa]|uniref:Uncharacterized protein n=1 Tax=Alosa alosa TaxID=278164 RepID=A0AAV6FIH7_9TELE|nr:uncharacterized protein LOC125288755 isoform X2 [Alosa alosa]KAG5261482.1 hypothetical protein AALO_G00284750 [Alosa alosa]
MAKNKAVGSTFYQPVSKDEVISPLAKEIYRRAKVLDSQEIWNILRAESESKLAQLPMSSLLKLLDEQQKCKLMAEEKDRTVLQRCRVMLMYKASQFHHDRTTLLITNNPLQTADDPTGPSSPARYLHHDTDHPTRYLHPDTIPIAQREATDGTSSCKQPPLKRTATSHSTRQEKAKTGGMSRGTVSASTHKSDAGTNMCDPHLGHLDFGTDRSSVKSRTSLSKEPLTISSLMENTTIVTAPGQGAFRHGQTTFWNVESS